MKHLASLKVSPLKIIAASRYLLAAFILGLLIITQSSRAIAALTNNLGSVDLNRALLSNASSNERLASFATAGSKFQQALAWDANYGFAYYNLGTLYAHFEDTQSAHDVLAKATAVMPGDALSLFQLGLTKAALGYEEGAIALWQQALAAPYFINTAQTYSREGDLVSALRDAHRATMIDPLLLSAYYALGDIYSKQKDFAGALQVSQTAVAISPNDVTSLYRLGKALRDADDVEQAAAVFRRVLVQSPEHTLVMKDLAAIYADQTQCEQAENVLQPLLSSKSRATDTVKALRLLGACYVNRQNPGYALPYLEQLAGFDTATLKDFMLLAQAYEALDRNSAAIDVYKHIMLLDPDHKPSQDALARLEGEGQ